MKKLLAIVAVACVAGATVGLSQSRSTAPGTPATQPKVSAPAAASQASSAPAKESYTIQRDILFAQPDGEKLYLDAYIPDGQGPHPGVLVIFGGAWRMGNRTQLAGYAKALAARGYSAFCITYRLCPKFKFPAQIDDCRAALCWVRQNASTYKVDVDHVGAIGYSAGAHLSCLLGVTGEKAKPGQPSTQLQAVAAGGTPCDFRLMPGKFLEDWLGPKAGELAVRTAASPAAMVGPSSAPMFFFHGQTDMVPLFPVKHMVEDLKKNKVETELHMVTQYPNGHMGACINREALDKAIDFFDKHLKRQSTVIRGEGTEIRQ